MTTMALMEKPATASRRATWRWQRGLAWASIPLILLVWMLLALRMPSYVLPQPWDVLREGLRAWQDGSLPRHLGASLLRELAGFGLAAALAIALGTAMGLSAGWRAFMGPVNSLFMAIPPIAWTPLVILFLGLGEASMLAVIVMAAMFPMAITVEEGVRSIEGGEVRAARTLGASRRQLLRFVYLPACLPFITAALRIGFSQAWRALIAAEMIGASKGIGWMVSTGGQIGNSSQVLLGIALIGLIAWLTESFVFRRLEARYSHWRGQ
ncbi:ABC transporter permease [Pelomonas cellulosilytica]|uniref:ABC transporter permease n=1 Tax=Pelomonas cellulosilytica TaxID=2906762 RepID=A0ABS8XNQ7_9BURK|nr:ABC transporter permease [Pelomonas sp. P8]MCE4553385.1 ABC transporter permease [Pelomonas sp. P8]